ncbi:MAG: DNA repair protein RecN [Bacteroidota bacterium]
MLQKLTIRNYTLIDSVDLELNKGLNIITGETGAGKSIMLGALSLILGQRAETKYFFNQDKKCIIEGHFVLDDQKLRVLFEESDIDFFEETTLRREISKDGKSRSFINDTPVTLSVMKSVGEQLIDIHSQHATLEVNDPAFQLLVVDTLANHTDELMAYRELYKKYKRTQVHLDTLRASAADARSRQDYEQFLFNELDIASLKAGEQEKLESEVEILNNAERIKRNLSQVNLLLSEQDPSASGLLRESTSQLQDIESYSSEYHQLSERLKSVLIEVKDIAAEISGLEEDIIFNPARIEEVNSRLNTIYSLQQKHKVINVQELLEIQEGLSNNLNSILNNDEEILKIETELIRIKETLERSAVIISESRLNAIKKAEDEVGSLLIKVGMPNAKIKIEQTRLQELNKDGLDNVSLLFSANIGQPPAPVGKVASGGELSRLMLSIKSVLARHTALPTLIFDEIDTGISGETAVRVGTVIGELETNMQVICITHLPQIAAKGNAHYFVYKNDEGERTTTGIRKLDDGERIKAIAEMLSGKDPGASAIQNAMDLLRVN